MKGIPSHVDPQKRACSLYEGIEYQDFWDGPDKLKLDELERLIISEQLPLSGKRILDVGCGYGRLADCYFLRFQEVVFFDGSMSLLRKAKNRWDGKGTYIAGDINHMPFRKGGFDSILMVRVLQHMPDSRACLRELRRVLCDGGKLLFTYHCKRNARRIVKWFFGIEKENPFSKEPAGMGSVLISHHPGYVKDLLQENGFSNIAYRGSGFVDKLTPMFGPLWRIVPPGLAISPFLGRTKLAPWIFCSASILHNRPTETSDSILDMLQCPVCGMGLRKENQNYKCIYCRHLYPESDGIIDFRV